MCSWDSSTTAKFCETTHLGQFSGFDRAYGGRIVKLEVEFLVVPGGYLGFTLMNEPFVYRFTWDPDKASSNRRDHHVTFEQAATVLRDPLALSRYDS
jgi:hypothetical protein